MTVSMKSDTVFDTEINRFVRSAEVRV